jgi:hypothetical protein
MKEQMGLRSGDLSGDVDQDKSDKGSNVVTKDNKVRDSDGSTTDEDDGDPKDAKDNPGSTPLSTNPSADERDARCFTFEFIEEGRALSSLNEEAIKSPNRTQIQESSSAAVPHVNRGAGTAEDKANWISFLSRPRNNKPDTPNREAVSRSPAYDPLPLDDSDKSVGDEETQDQDMVALTENEVLPNTEGALLNIEEPADPYTQEEATEEQFIEALIERNRNGELDTIQEVIQAILDIGGEALGDEGVPITFTARIALKLLQRSDPLSLLTKNYEEKQNDMMKDQRKIFRDQMAYLHRKTLERVGTDTKTMVAVMRETLDKAEKELITLKSENKSLVLKHTLLSTEHAVMQAKYPSHGNESGDPLAQYQRDLVDWQNRYTAKDNEARMLATQLGVLTSVIQTQGLNLVSSSPAPVPAPALAPAPTHIAPSVTNEDINLNGWDFGGTRQPAWGNTRPAAVNREPVHNDGWGPAPCSLSG